MIILLSVLAILVLVEVLHIAFIGSPVKKPIVSREPQRQGNGPDICYVIMGDSTAVVQGGDYTQGYSLASVRQLAQDYAVTWVNLAVPGSRAHTVLTEQVPTAIAHKPDIVLIAVGANDVTHLTSITKLSANLQNTIQALRSANPRVAVILTGSPDMGSVPRFLQPVRWLAGIRTQAINTIVEQLADDQQVIFAPIARQTGPIFRKHHELFAADKFHPNSAGYRLWTPVITAAMHKAIAFYAHHT